MYMDIYIYKYDNTIIHYAVFITLSYVTIH